MSMYKNLGKTFAKDVPIVGSLSAAARGDWDKAARRIDPVYSLVRDHKKLMNDPGKYLGDQAKGFIPFGTENYNLVEGVHNRGREAEMDQSDDPNMMFAVNRPANAVETKGK